MEDIDCKHDLLDDILRQSGPEDFEYLFNQFLETRNTCYETSIEIPLPLTLPDSCPVTQTIPEEIFDITKIEDFHEKTFQTDTPELESYLKQINSMQSTTSYSGFVQSNKLKRKCDSVTLKNKKTKVRKRARTQLHTKDLFRRQSVEDDDIPCHEKTMNWEKFNCGNLYKLYDSSFVERKFPSLSVTCDKGISLSPTESVYICQKKNHFQLTVVLQDALGLENFIKNKDSYEQVVCYKVHLYAVKSESPHSPCSKITIEQSAANRSKCQYQPVRFSSEDTEDTSSSLTIGRLHFSETTTNNMRKKGKLNPDQRYFLLVVDVCAYTKEGIYPICCQASEKIIVRASNPGQFETDTALWSKGKRDDTIYRMGNVGLNNDKPEQALSVNGNLRLTGKMLQPADERLIDFKEKIDTSQSLENIANLNIYKYRQFEEYEQYAGLKTEHKKQNVGVLGYEVDTLIPDAVTNESSITLPGGKTLKDVYLIDKDRLLMESLGALQELYKISQFLTSRLMEMERKNEIMELVLKNPISSEEMTDED